MTADARTEVIPACVEVGEKAPLPRRPEGHVPSVAETTPPSGLPVLPSTVELGVVVVEQPPPVPPAETAPSKAEMPLPGRKARQRPAPTTPPVLASLPPSDTPTYDVLAAWFAPRLDLDLEEVRRAW